MLAVDERPRSLIPTVRAPIPAPESPPSDAHRVGVHNVAGSHKGNFCSAATFRGHQAGKNRPDGERVMLGTILIIILVLLLVGALPTWPYSTGWGYYPGGGLGLILIIVIILVLVGRI